MKGARFGGVMFICLILMFHFANGQEFTNDAGEREKLFIDKVKQIEEFFERFNDNSNSAIREIYKARNIKFNISRSKLIGSLFNLDGKSWQKTEIDSFVKKALQTKMPSGNNWYGENWFCEVNCRFQYNNTEINIPLILKVVTDETNHSKWMITGIRPNTLSESINPGIPITIRKVKHQFINPASHGTNFIELENAFSDKKYLTDYFEDDFFSRNPGVQFYQCVLAGKIKFLYAENVKYHFLNVEDYIFTVEYFSRDSVNAGWLINKIQPAGLKEKENFIKSLLGK